MLFAQVIGQQAVQAQLLHMAQQGRMPHALMLHGPLGSGKRTLAMAVAQYLLCYSPSPSDACGQCPACRHAARMEHPDLHFSYPTVGTNALSEHFLKEWRAMMEKSPYFDAFEWVKTIAKDNNQGNITKEECVSIVRKLSLKAFLGQRKVLVMWLPEYLGKEGNRLLKLIEEPPLHTYFILLAENPERVLPTILSRCQMVRVGPLSDDEVATGLKRLQPELSDEQVRTAAILANGNLHAALQLIETHDNRFAARFIDWMRACHLSNAAGWVSMAEQLAELGREPQKYLLSYGLHFLREALVHQLAPALPARLQGQELVTAQKFMARLDAHRIGLMANLLSQAYYHIERNANAKVLLLHVSIQLHRIMHGREEAPRYAAAGKAADQAAPSASASP